jgi:hypothetical protein
MILPNLPMLVCSSYSFLGPVNGVAVIGDENHQKLGFGNCAYIFTI